MRMVAIVCALIWAGAMPAAAQAQSAVVIKYDAWACRTREDYHAVNRLAASGDREGAIALYRQQVTFGACIPLQFGERLIVEERPWFSGMVKARRLGDTRSLWTAEDFVRVD